jgi:hypothetical protein
MSDWAWDDEDTAEPPYIQVYNDDGTVYIFPYATNAERVFFSWAAGMIVVIVVQEQQREQKEHV